MSPLSIPNPSNYFVLEKDRNLITFHQANIHFKSNYKFRHKQLYRYKKNFCSKINITIIFLKLKTS